MNPNLVILAGGISSRMKKPSSSADPALSKEALRKSKAMIGLGKDRRPLMDYLLFNARESGYKDVVILVGEDDKPFRSHYGKADKGNEFHGLKISYAIQPIPKGRSKPLGTADALACALQFRKDWHGQKFTVCNADNLYSRAAFSLLLATPHSTALIDYDWSALRFEPSRIEQFSVLRKSLEGILEAIIEKPTPEEIAASADRYGRIRVSMNIFRFSYDVILPVLLNVPLHPVRNEKDLPAAIMMLLAENPNAVATIPRSEYVPDLTRQDDIAIVRDYLNKNFPNFSL